MDQDRLNYSHKMNAEPQDSLVLQYAFDYSKHKQPEIGYKYRLHTTIYNNLTIYDKFVKKIAFLIY